MDRFGRAIWGCGVASGDARERQPGVVLRSAVMRQARMEAADD